MRKIIFAVILVLFITGCKGSITGGTVDDTEEILAEETAEDSCRDTDNGIDKENRGTVSGFIDGEKYEMQDKCIAGLLIEYYCENSKPLNQNFRCEDKCLNGACV